MEVSTSPRLPELPNEVLQNIIDRLSPQEHLKNVRLSCKLFAMLAEPRLFRRMTLVPYIDCLKQFTDLMRSNPIARHVKAINYEVKWRYTAGLHAKETQADTVAINNHLATKSLRSLRDEALEVMLLSECLKVLPSLRRVRVRELLCRDVEENAAGTLPLRIPSYFQRLFEDFGTARLARCGNLHRSREIVPSSKPLLLSCFSAGTKLLELDIFDLDPSAFLEPIDKQCSLKELPMYQTIFAQLKTLKLVFEQCFTLALPNARRNFANLLSGASNLEHLSLTLSDRQAFKWRSLEANHSWLSSLVRDCHGHISHEVIFPNLKILELSCMVCQEAELTALIRTHENTLKRVKMSDITLVPQSAQGPSPCWVRLLEGVRSSKIEFAMESFFSNSRSQLWIVEWDPTPPEYSLKNLTLKWLRKDGAEECPVQRAAVKLDSEGADIRSSEDEFFEGDRTFNVQRVPRDGDSDMSDDISEDSWPDEYDELYESFDEFWDDDFDEDGYPYDPEFYHDSLLHEMLDQIRARAL